ncbi:putative leader peptide [Streptomyces sp. NPDC058664]
MTAIEAEVTDIAAPRGDARVLPPVAGGLRASTLRDVIDPARGHRYLRAMLRTALLTTRGHIDLLRVASAACRRGR